MTDERVRQTPTSRDYGARDIPGSAQVFGVLFPVITGVVVAVTASGVLVTVLAALAALALSVAVLVGLSHRSPGRREKIKTAGAAVVALMLVLVAVAVHRGSAAGSRPERIADGGADPEPLVSVSAYQLRSSADTATNDQDKVDLDTGCPGWGAMDILIGPKRCGELAELILEDDELHTRDNAAMIKQLPDGERAAYASCRELLVKPTGARGRISLRDLRAGTELCVRTDKGHIAAVRVDSLARGPILTIDFTVWTP